MGLSETARAFFNACDTGQGWEACKPYCTDSASFSAQAGALADVTTIEAYCDWMQGLLVPLPDAHYELKAFAVDEDRQTVVIAAVFHGTHSVDGPFPATNLSVASDYVYTLVFEDGKIVHMTKIWNDMHALKELGWA